MYFLGGTRTVFFPARSQVNEQREHTQLMKSKPLKLCRSHFDHVAFTALPKNF